MKKILIVTRGDSIGGATEYLLTLIKMLHENYDVEIHMTYSREDIKQYYLKKFDYIMFHHVYIARPIQPVSDITSIVKLKTLIRVENFDVVHTNTTKGGIVGRIAAKLAHVPFVFHTVHGFSFHEQSSTFSIFIQSTIEKVAARCCNYIITVSDFHRDWAIKLGIARKDKIISIPNGLDPLRVKQSKDRNIMRKELNIPSDQIACFTIGRLAKQKGLEYLVQSIELLENKKLNKNYHFYIAGSGELENQLIEQSNALNISNKISFLGYRNDVGDLLNASDLVIIPSLWEGLSISLLEAMASGKAIITTNIGSNISVVEDKTDALLVNTKDSFELYKCIAKLIENDELRKKIANSALNKFNTYFTKDIMLSKYAMFYENKAKLKKIND